MGFKRMQEFNLAMLGKQAWRILSEPNLLIARLLKARYFPKFKFEEAGLGTNPSYVWRSIMASHQFVCNASVRKIGRGESVSVWKDAWLPVHNHTKISSPVIQGLEDVVVSNLILSDKLEWDVDLLRELFSEIEVCQILKIPLSGSRMDDPWMWIDGEKGVYSVKSAYRRLCQVEYGASPFELDFNWLEIWKLFAPPKVKFFG